MDIWTYLWIGWGAAFAVIEGVALYRDKVDPNTAGTLSEHLRIWFHVNTKVGRTIWLAFSAGFFVMWFIPHIAFGPRAVF